MSDTATPRRHWRNRVLRAALGALLAMPFTMTFMDCIRVMRTLPSPPIPLFIGSILNFWQGLPLMAIVCSPFMLIAILAATIDPKGRKHVPMALGFLVVVVGSLAIRGFPLEWRNPALLRAAERGMTIVEALEEFRTRNHAYPGELSELVPEFLSEIPRTSMVGHPDYRYRRSEGGPYGPHGYWLGVSVGAMTDFDDLFYIPPCPDGETCPENETYMDDPATTPLGPWWYFDD